MGDSLVFIANLSCQEAFAASSPIVGVHHSRKNSSSVWVLIAFCSQYPQLGQINVEVVIVRPHRLIHLGVGLPYIATALVSEFVVFCKLLPQGYYPVVFQGSL